VAALYILIVTLAADDVVFDTTIDSTLITVPLDAALLNICVADVLLGVTLTVPAMIELTFAKLGAAMKYYPPKIEEMTTARPLDIAVAAGRSHQTLMAFPARVSGEVVPEEFDRTVVLERVLGEPDVTVPIPVSQTLAIGSLIA
jgi:hypothetical protein